MLVRGGETLLSILDTVCIGYDFNFYLKMLTRYGRVHTVEVFSKNSFAFSFPRPHFFL
jgi:D-arabinose 1-dehydrogenase-like Zn-dependent alcohol dehydrogenase